MGRGLLPVRSFHLAVVCQLDYIPIVSEEKICQNLFQCENKECSDGSLKRRFGMRLICALMVFLNVLIAVPTAADAALEKYGTDFEQSDQKRAFRLYFSSAGQGDSAVKVRGGARQTITAVKDESSEVKEERSEAWQMVFSGLGILLISVLAFFVPKAFMYGRRSWFWRGLFGEPVTAVMIRVISFVVGAAGILIMLGGILLLFEN